MSAEKKIPPAPFPPIVGQPYDPWRVFRGRPPAALLSSRDLSPSAKLVYIALMRYADRSGRCWPSQKQLALDTGLPLRTVEYCTPMLRRAGYISVKRRRGTTAVYALLFHPTFSQEPQILRFSEMQEPQPLRLSGSQEPQLLRSRTASIAAGTYTTELGPRSPTVPSSSKVVTVPDRKPAARASSGDDDDRIRYASEQDELAALIRQATGSLPDRKLVWQIWVEVQSAGATLREYLDDIKPRIWRLRQAPGPGFFLSHARQFASKANQPVPEPRPAPVPCDCRHGVREDGSFCTRCQLGRDLARVTARIERERAAGASASPKLKLPGALG